MLDAIKKIFSKKNHFHTEEKLGSVDQGAEEDPRPLQNEDLGGNHLGKAAVARDRAKESIQRKNYDHAWEQLHVQQSEFLQHAAKHHFTKRQTLALVASVHREMARVLRLEGKHDQALTHMLYVAATSMEISNPLRTKLVAHFKRCRFQDDYTDDQAELAARLLRKAPDIRAAQTQVSRWRNGSAPILSINDLETEEMDRRWISAMGADFEIRANHDHEATLELLEKISRSDSLEEREFWAEKLVMSLISDWDGVLDATGTPIPFNRQNAAAVLADEPALAEAITKNT